MKSQYKNLVVCVVILLSLIVTGCPRPKSTTVNGNCTRNMTTGVWTCGGGVVVVFRGVAQVEEDSEMIVDVPAGWSTDLSEAVLDFEANHGTPEAENMEIPLSLITSTEDPVETGATVYTLVGDETSVEDAIAEQDLENESQFSYQVAFTQANCNLADGEYTFHLRSKDSSGVTYVGAVTIDYEVASEGSCVGSSATVKQ